MMFNIDSALAGQQAGGLILVDVALICQSGRRSAMAAAKARRPGLEHRSVSGGTSTWDRQVLDIDFDGGTA